MSDKDSERINRIVERVRPYTMGPDIAIFKTVELTLQAAAEAGEKDVIAECGTWKGGASLAMILAQKEFFGKVKHPVWMFDSYEGLPEVTEDDGVLAADWQTQKTDPTYHNNATADLAGVLAMMERERIEPTSYRIFKGWFNQTLRPAVKELNQAGAELALLRLDGDWYESTRDCLYWLWPKLRKGAPCILDDYYAWDGCALAVHEYFGMHRIAARIRSMPFMHGSYVLKKPRENPHEL